MFGLFNAVERETRSILRSVMALVSGDGEPTLRIGVTGLSRAGKTVFITALTHHLLTLKRLPVLKAAAEGRIARVRLAPQENDAVPRFAYEDHLAALTAPDRRWPDSTRRISELRLVIEFEGRGAMGSGPRRLALDIVDYPGEWLLDLPLLETSYADWSRATVAAARSEPRRALAAGWLADLETRRPEGPADEHAAQAASEAFKAYLTAARAAPEAFSLLPPGRFLMPGDLEGSPALTFAPLDLKPGAEPGSDTLAGLMSRRFEAYKSRVVRPFFREHFGRLDRQVVLVDVLSALDAGPASVADLERALADVLGTFRVGRNSILGSLFSPRIERVLFAATKADHLHHADHDRLEAILRLLVDRAAQRAEGAGAEVEVVALASVRATREAVVRQDGQALNCIVGVPRAGETIDGEVFDGVGEAAIDPGELPADPRAVLSPDGLGARSAAGDVRFVRFRPPAAPPDPSGRGPVLPHIRLDRALEFLVGDLLA